MVVLSGQLFRHVINACPSGIFPIDELRTPGRADAARLRCGARIGALRTSCSIGRSMAPGKPTRGMARLQGRSAFRDFLRTSRPPPISFPRNADTPVGSDWQHADGVPIGRGNLFFVGAGTCGPTPAPGILRWDGEGGGNRSRKALNRASSSRRLGRVGPKNRRVFERWLWCLVFDFPASRPRNSKKVSRSKARSMFPTGQNHRSTASVGASRPPESSASLSGGELNRGIRRSQGRVDSTIASNGRACPGDCGMQSRSSKSGLAGLSGR